MCIATWMSGIGSIICALFAILTYKSVNSIIEINNIVHEQNINISHVNINNQLYTPNQIDELKEQLEKLPLD